MFPTMILPAPFRHALPIAEHELKRSIHVTYAGWTKVKAGEVHGNRSAETPAFFRYNWNEGRILPEFCLVLISEGSGELETRQGVQRIRQGNAFLLRPGEWHRHRPLSETGWTNLWIAFEGTLPQEWMLRSSFHLDGNLAVIEDYGMFLAEFQRLLASVHRNPGENPPKLSCQLIGLLSHFMKEASLEETHDLHDDELVSRALAFIWGNRLEAVAVPDVAAHLECGRRSLERRFKKGTGRSVLEEIQACRIDRARRLLLETPISVKECAVRAGFNTSGHMRQVMRKEFGMSPEAYRMQMQPDGGNP